MQGTTKPFQNILVATDFSEAAKAALETAVTIAKRSGGHMTVVHVVPSIPSASAATAYGLGWEAIVDDFTGFRKALVADARKELDSLAKHYEGSGISISTQVLTGVAFEEIVRAVKQHHSELLIIGTRGMSAMKRFLVGSTATKLVRLCPCPVWVARQQPTRNVETILVPVELSESSSELIAVAHSLSKITGAKLHLLHVYSTEDLYGFPPVNPEFRAQLAGYRRQIRQYCLEQLEQLFESVSGDHDTVTLHVAHGIPWKIIRSVAKRVQADLVVMGTIGRSGMSGLLIGNTAEKVLHTCNQSLLVVKPAVASLSSQPARNEEKDVQHFVPTSV